MRTSRGELFAKAYELDPNWRRTHDRIGQSVSSELRACECIHSHGFHDAESGTVDAPCGFFYRVDRWIVRVDQQGFLYLCTHETEDEASKTFGVLDDEYSDWENEYIEL